MVEPGTTILFPERFDSTYGGDDINRTEFTVHGTLMIQATEAEPVIMTSASGNPQAHDWAGIKADGAVRLEYVTIEYASVGISHTGDAETDELYVDHCTIQYNSEAGISAQAQLEGTLPLTIRNSIITDNGGNGIYLRCLGTGTISDAGIKSNVIHDNGGNGIYIVADGSNGDPELSALIDDNLVYNNSTAGIHTSTTSGAQSVFVIRNNTVSASDTGLYCQFNQASADSTLDIYQNELYSGTDGLSLEDISSNIIPTVHGNSIHDNARYGIYLSLAAQAEISGNEIYANTVYDLYNNSSANVNATGNWWGVDTTNEMNSGENPKDISVIFDSFDDSGKGTVDYSDWITAYLVPSTPILDEITSPTQESAQIVSGTKDADSAIIINGTLAVPINGETSWNYTLSLSEGNNSLTVYAQNESGLVSGTINREIVRDTTAPELVSSIPVDGSVLNRTLDSIDLTLIEAATAIDEASTEASGVVVDEDNDDVPGTWTVENSHALFVPASPFDEGTYSVSLMPADTPLGNQQEITLTFTIDLSAPSAPGIDSPQSPTSASTQTITGTKDPGTAVWLNDSEIVPADQETEWSYDLSMNLEGENFYSLWTVDQAGNRSGSVEFTVVLDRIAPAFVESSPTDGEFVSSLPGEISLVFFDQTTGIDEQASVATGTVQNSDGDAVSGTWNLSGAGTLTFTPDEPLAEGDYSASIQAIDLAGNSAARTITFTYDATAPAAPGLNPVESPTHVDHQLLSGTKDAETSLWINDEEVIAVSSSTDWSYDYLLGEGENHIAVTCRDRAGNISESVTALIVYDDVSPYPVSVNADGNGTGTAVELDWNGYDEEGQEDVASYHVYMDTSLFTQVGSMSPVATLPAGTFVYTVNGLETGTTYWFAVVAEDENGNALISVTPVSAVPADKEAPEEIANPAIQHGETTIGLSWTPPVSADLSGYRIYINGSSDSIQLDASQVSWEATGLDPATRYSFRITTFDTSGNESAGVMVEAVTFLSNPTGLTAVAYSGRVALAWDGVIVDPASLFNHYAIYVNSTDFNSVAGMTPCRTVTGTTADVAGLSDNVTYYVAVTSVNSSGGEKPDVTTIHATPVPDSEGPQITDISFNGSPLADGAQLVKSGTVSLAASDPSGVSRVVFDIDGTQIHSDFNGADGYTCLMDLPALTDGAHTLGVSAWDTLGNQSSISISILINLAAPASAPVITSPANGITTNHTVITVTGTGGEAPEVIIYNNNQEAASAVADASGAFSASITLQEGANSIQAAARNRGGTGPLSQAVLVTLDTTIPFPPTNVMASTLSEGAVKITWREPEQGRVVGYNIYRSDSPFSSTGDAQLINSAPVTVTMFTDLPTQDGTYYYSLTGVDEASNQSQLSSQVSVRSDRTPPRASSIEYIPEGPFDDATDTFGAGLVRVKLTVSEPLSATPFLTITPEGAVPQSVILTRNSDLMYTGYFTISDSLPAGTAWAVFSARDMAGNRGVKIDSGESISIDPRGPVVVRIVTSPEQPMRNDENDPLTVSVTIGLDEPVREGTQPQLTCQFSGTDREPIVISALTELSPAEGEKQAWQGSFVLPPDAGLSGPETFSFIYSAVDNLENMGNAINAPNVFQVYQGELPPLDPPASVHAESLAQGRIRLTWEPVGGAAGYVIYRQAPGEDEVAEYSQLGPVTEFVDEPDIDGTYLYAVATVREHNGEASKSALSEIVSAVSDSVAPDTPYSLSLELLGQGIHARWDGPYQSEEVTYRLYRNSTDIISVDGLTPVISGVEEMQAIDPLPSSDNPYYAVTAVDRAGNESDPSESAYHNLDLLPVSGISVLVDHDSLPVVSWLRGQGNIAGCNLYVGADSELVKLNDTPLTELSYTDQGFTGDERRYTLKVVDNDQHESVGRSVVLPCVEIVQPHDQMLRRGIMNRLEYTITNSGFSAIKNARLRIQLDTHVQNSTRFSVDAGETRTIPVAVGGYDDLPDITPVVTTLEIEPNPGENVQLIDSTELETGDGALILDIINDELTRGTSGSVSFTVENTGGEEIEIVTATGGGTRPSDEITLYLEDMDGNVISSASFKQALGENLYTLADGDTVVRIEPEGIFRSGTMTIPVPVSVPDDVVLRVRIRNIYHHKGHDDQVVMQGADVSRDALIIDTAYRGELLSITPETSSGNEDIIITGRAVDSESGLAVPSVQLNLFITVNGYERYYPVFAGDDGTFSFNFTPLQGENGTYKVSIIHPELNNRPEQGQFTIKRISVVPDSIEVNDDTPSRVYLSGVSPTTINLSSPRNYENRIGIHVAAGSENDAGNVRLIYEAQYQPDGTLPQGIHLAPGNPLPSLPVGQTGNLDFTLWADNSADETGRVVLKIVSDGFEDEPWGSVVVNTHFSEAHPVLYYTPDHVETGITFNQNDVQTVILENKGLAVMKGVSLSLVAEDGNPAPSWMHTSTETNLGDLEISEKREISLTFGPNDSVAEGNYLAYLVINAVNHPEVRVPLFVTVTQSGQGSAIFKVSDIYTGTINERNEIIQGLEGARIRLTNEVLPELVYTETTDQSGEVMFQDLQAGRYRYRISAANHQDQTGRCWIMPGITTSQDVFLAYELVTVEWSVVPTNIEDHYTIALSAEYKTDVPAAVVVAEPSSVSLPRMKPGDVFNGEFTLTNYGLIRAFDINFNLPESDAYFRYELLSDMPTSIEAKQHITIPYRVTCLMSPEEEITEQGGGGGAGGCWYHQKCIKIPYRYKCSNGKFFTSSTVHCTSYLEGECENVGGGGGEEILPPGGENAPGKPGDPPGGGGGSDITRWLDWISVRTFYDFITGGGENIRFKPKPGSTDGKYVTCWPIAKLKEETVKDFRLPADINTIWETGCWVNAVLGQYLDQADDLTVKVPGGAVTVQRKFYNGKWHWDYVDDRLEFVPDNLGRLVALNKSGVTYSIVEGTSVFKNGDFEISKVSDGYRWKDQQGNWKKYNASGILIAHGNRVSTTATCLILDGKVRGVMDANGAQVLWFSYSGDHLITIRDAEGRQFVYGYTGDNLTTVIDPEQKVCSYYYDGENRIIRSVDAAGRITKVTYDSDGHVSSVTDSRGKGHFFEYAYDSAKKEYFNRTKTSSGKVVETWYNEDGETKRVDINGRTRLIVHDVSHAWTYIISAFYASGTEISPISSLPVPASAKEVISIDEKGKETKKTYDTNGNITRITYPDGAGVQFWYWGDNSLRSFRDERGVYKYFEYDSQGRLIRKTEAVDTPEEMVTTYTYDTYGQLLTATIKGNGDTPDATTRMEYDSSGNIISITDPEGNTTSFLEHDCRGKVLRMRDARGYEWRYEYDDLGRRTSKIDPVGNVTRFEFDGANNPISVINASGKRFQYEYDDHNNVIRVVQPDGAALRNIYNSDNLPVVIYDQEGKVSLREYDNEGRLLKRRDGAGNEIRYYYDDTTATFVSSKKPVRIKYPGHSRRLYYDKRDRIIRETDILDDGTSYSTTYSYDAAGNLISITDQEGHVTAMKYDSRNRLVEVTNPAGAKVLRAYDVRGNLIFLTNPNGETVQYEYDRNNRLTGETLPNGRKTSYTYDAAGNLVEFVDPKGQKIVSVYDQVNRLIERRFFAADNPDVPVKTVTFEYNLLGLMTGYDDGITQGHYVYDDMGRKVEESVTYEGGLFSLGCSYSYYSNGLLKSFTGPDGTTYSYTWDSGNRLTGITIPGQGLVTINSYSWNSPSEVTLPGGSTLAYGYDALMRLVSMDVSDPGGNTLLHSNYELSPSGQIVARHSEAGDYNYQYADWPTLLSVTYPSGREHSFTYDANDNRLSDSDISGDIDYGSDEQLLKYGELSFTYDENGNLVTRSGPDGETHYFYNVEGRLIRMEDGNNSIIATYYYDPFGRRLSKETGGTTTYFFYSDAGLAGEYDSAGSEIKTYGYMPGSCCSMYPLFQKMDDSYYWYLNDHLGTPQKIIDRTGRIVWSAMYDVFGSAQVIISDIENNLRLPGQYYDSETGLHYNLNRYYDPATARYIRRDPMRFTLNPYVYALSNPVKVTDPKGLCAVANGINQAFWITMDTWVKDLGIPYDVVDEQYLVEAGRGGDLDYAVEAAQTIKEGAILANKTLAIFVGPEGAVLANMINDTQESANAFVTGYTHNGLSGGIYQAGVTHLNQKVGSLIENRFKPYSEGFGKAAKTAFGKVSGSVLKNYTYQDKPIKLNQVISNGTSAWSTTLEVHGLVDIYTSL